MLLKSGKQSGEEFLKVKKLETEQEKEDACRLCGRIVQPNHQGLQHDDCEKWSHSTCEKIGTEEYKYLTIGQDKYLTIGSAVSVRLITGQ